MINSNRVQEIKTSLEIQCVFYFSFFFFCKSM